MARQVATIGEFTLCTNCPTGTVFILRGPPEMHRLIGAYRRRTDNINWLERLSPWQGQMLTDWLRDLYPPDGRRSVVVGASATEREGGRRL